MPLIGRQKTKRQKAQIAAMQKRRWLPKSPMEDKPINPADCRLLSTERKKHKKELEKVRRSKANAWKREQRAREKLKKVEHEAQVQANEAAKAVVEQYKGQFKAWSREKESLKKDLAKLNARNRREPLKIQHAVQKALEHASDSNTDQPTIRYVKDKRGIVQDWARNAIITLVNEGVPMSKTWSVTKANADVLGVTLVGKWSSRTSRRVVHEGGVAAGLMIVEYAQTCIAMTLSGDGTTHKNIQYSSRHAIAIPPNSDPPKDLFLGITPEVNHTTATQFEGWKETIQHLCDDYNESPLGNMEPINPTCVWEKVKGYLGDHASDQKKLSATLQRYHWECDRELRGEAAMVLDEHVDEREQVLVEKGRELMEAVGGPEGYLALPIDGQLQFARRVVREAQICLGERAYQRLSPEEKEIVDYWVWSGCAMHKDLNAMKGGVERMSRWWGEFGDGMAPVALMNKFKAIAAKSGSVREESLAGPKERGGEKLTALLGSLVKHRETKVGHQERFRAFSVSFLKTPRPIQFPDTSNNRYQTHGYAATEILFHLDLYRTFLESVADSKALGNELNHLEQNVKAGLDDPPTLTELSVMSLYSQAISIPFTGHIRARSKTNTPLNGLDLGPDYDRIKQHMEAVISNPDLLLGLGASHETGVLYGKTWDNGDAIAFIQTNQDSLPHLREVLIAFFQGALETWKEFTKDICDDPKVTGATPEQRHLAFRHPSNDRNEGALGDLRQQYRAYPGITFGIVNAKLMCKLNPGVVDYVSNLSPVCRCYLRGAARQREQSKAYQGFLLSQADEDAKNAKEKRAAAEKRKTRVQNRMDKLNAFKPILSLKKLKEKMVDGDRADRIKEQLSWHRRIGGDVNIPAGFHAFRKAKAWVVMVGAVWRHRHGVAHQKLKEQAEIDELVDPFTGAEITSLDMECSEDGSSEDQSNTVGSDDSGRSDTGHDNDTSTAVGAILAYDISLDLVVNSEDEDIDLDGEGTESESRDTCSEDGSANTQDEEEPEAMLSETEDEEPVDPDHSFDIELDVVPPQPTRRYEDQRPSPYTAGCVWTAEDWSCSYDAVFMAFWALYEQSSGSWRNDWIQRAPDWNTPLSNNFDHLIILADTPIGVHDRAKWFSRYRDRLRDQLSHKYPGSFPRRGPVPASASRILEILFGQDTGPYLMQHLVCGDCGAQSQTRRNICFLAASYGRQSKSLTWLHSVWTDFVHRSATNAARLAATCSRCQGPNKVQVLEMLDVPWIWFERGEYSPVWPSLTLTFNSPFQQLTYSLRAIIYAGGHHFTIRFRGQSGGWWRHDGRAASGVPQPDDIQTEAALLMNGSRFACTLIYRRDDP